MSSERVRLSEVAGLVRSLDGECDVTLTVSRQGADGHLLLAVTGSDAFVGLDVPGGLFQYAAGRVGAGSHRFNIGGQATDIDSRYVVDLQSAASAVLEWLQSPDASPSEAWERQ